MAKPGRDGVKKDVLFLGGLVVVAVAAGVGYGEEGEGHVRIAMVENEQRIRQAARNIKRFLAEHARR